TVAHHEVEASRDWNTDAVCIRPVTDLAHSHSESRRSQGGVSRNVFASDEVVACNNLRSGRETLGKGADTYVLVSLSTDGVHVVGEAVDQPEGVIHGLLKSKPGLETALLKGEACRLLGVTE